MNSPNPPPPVEAHLNTHGRVLHILRSASLVPLIDAPENSTSVKLHFSSQERLDEFLRLWNEVNPNDPATPTL